MLSFKAHIPYDNKPLECYFSKIIAPDARYFVEVSSNESILARFEMQTDHFNKWRVLHPAPEWILNLESQLAFVIHKNIVLNQ
jgi:hypothetical protein